MKRAAVLAAFLFLGATPAHSDMGPCRLDVQRETLICGADVGAAAVIHDTVSPSEKLALAWRSKDGPPTVEPDDEDIELLVVRLADGAILVTTKTEYWNTGEMHANRRNETAYWSPDSKLLVHEYESRFSSDIVELFTLDANDKATGPLDLLAPLNHAAHEKLHALIKSQDEFTFSLASKKQGEKELAIDNSGNIRAEVMLWQPKEGPFYYFTINAKAIREHDKLAVKIVSVVYRGMEKANN